MNYSKAISIAVVIVTGLSAAIYTDLKKSVDRIEVIEFQLAKDIQAIKVRLSHIEGILGK